jgi:hypothetical protein
MQVTVDTAKLLESSLFVASPLYGGLCYATYTESLLKLVIKAMQIGLKVQVHTIINESLITRARNYCVDEFLRSDCTHMMFIDGDVGFNADDVILMIALQISDPEKYDVLAGAYPKKTISWEKIKLAVDKGVADEDPNNLAKYVGDYVINPIQKEGTQHMRLDEPVEIAEAGTGFMMIPRATFTKYNETYPHLRYLPDHARSAHFDGTREITAYFDVVIDPDTRRYLSEDYMFCQNVRKMGGKVWLIPDIPLTHTGTYTYGGSLLDLATIGADPTAGQVAHKKVTKGKK